ncbi:unnamed protein product, partial [Mesorhabditis belari]|uniref:Uncharacterized protein n=1 Tax=Mesorhabditis belari TaxID=2138241 RepID=A0AAF3J249_9BILA
MVKTICTRQTIYLIIAIAIALIGIFLVGPFYFVLFGKLVETQIPLKENEDGSYSKLTFYWQSFPVDEYWKHFLFNITNADEFIYENAMPRLVEVGPYTYKEWEFKQEVTFFDNGNMVYYKNNKSWAFQPDLSCKYCLYGDYIMMPNPAFMAVVGEMFKWNQTSGANNFILNLATMLVGEYPLRKIPIAGILFDSYNDPLIDVINSPLYNLLLDKNGFIFGVKIPVIPALGYFPHFNHTCDEDYVAYTGKDDVKNTGKIVRWAGNTSLNWWKGDYASSLDCSDGSFNTPNLKKDQELKLFQSLGCRTFRFKYDKKGNVGGIPTLDYKLKTDEFDTTLEKNWGYRYENYEKKDYVPSWPCGLNKPYNPNQKQCDAMDCTLYENWCDDCCNGTHYKDTVFMPPGIVPMRCQPGRTVEVPFAAFISPPHFLWSPDEVTKSMVGLAPDPVKHDPSLFQVHGLSGAAVKGLIRLQISIPLYQDKALLMMRHLRNAIIPCAWIELTVEMKSFAHRFMKLVMVTIPRIILGIGISLIILPILAIVLYISWGHWRKKTKQQGKIEAPLIEQSEAKQSERNDEWQ